jgi:hypothetical protein
MPARALVFIATLLLPVLAGADAATCGPLPCTDAQFVTQLLKVANETNPDAVPRTFWATFPPELAQHTRVLVSDSLTAESANNVVRFVRLGELWYPLSYGGAGRCVALEPLDRLFRADGWQGGVTERPPAAARVWLYSKGRTQLTVQAVTPADAAGACAMSVLLTYR